jgi:hypothetical protein
MPSSVYNPPLSGKEILRSSALHRANSSCLWGAELRPGNGGTWNGSKEVLDTSFAHVPPEMREVRVQAGAGFGFDPVFAASKRDPHNTRWSPVLLQRASNCCRAFRTNP